MLPYDEIEMWHGHSDLHMDWLEGILNTPDDSDIGFFFEVEYTYQDNIKEKTKIFPFCPGNKFIHKEKYNDYMKKTQPKRYTKPKKLICDWTVKKNYFIHYRLLNFYVRHGMVVEKIHEIISLEQSKWLENYLIFNTQERDKAENQFEEDF